MAESEEELKSLLMKVKEESERASLRLNTKKTKIMASGPITSWQIEGENVEVMTDFLFLGPRITVDSDCSREIRRRLFFDRKAMTNLHSVLRSRGFTLPTKVRIAKAMVFPVVTYGCENWTIKKAECQRTDAFKLRCWRRILKVPWTGRRSNQSILREIILKYSLEWQIGKAPDAGKDWGQKENRASEDNKMAGWHHQCNGHKLGQTWADGEEQGGLAFCCPWGCKELDMTRRMDNNTVLLLYCLARIADSTMIHTDKPWESWRIFSIPIHRQV